MKIFKVIIIALIIPAIGACGIKIVKKYQDPLSAQEHIQLGVAYEEKGELDGAAEQYRLAIKKDDRAPDAYVYLGNVMLDQGRYDDARHAYQRALELTPGNPDVMNNLAWALMKTHKPDEARTYATMAVNKGGTRKYAYLDTLGMIQLQLGDVSGARRSFALALSLAPRDKSIRGEIEDHLKHAQTPSGTGL